VIFKATGETPVLPMKTIRFAIIGGGLMGKEIASATARWAHLLEPAARPELVAVCSRSTSTFGWFEKNFASVRKYTTNYREILASKEIDVVYIAVPHHLHEEMYVSTIEAGKHLLGEKPFGIDRKANDAILAACKKHPNVFVRCTSEFPFFPGVQKIGSMIDKGEFGRIIEVNAGFLHSSDLDPNKVINWKRQVEFNGEYGVMGDLGMHILHVPLRAGFQPLDVRAVLSKIISERPDGKGNKVPCKTWDNATLLCTSRDHEGAEFPMTLKTQRISPGQRNTWYLEILGTKTSARWSTLDPKRLDVLHYTPGGEQNWQRLQVAFDPAYKTITGPNFEFGFTDSMLQMWAAFLHEMTNGKPIKPFAGLPTPEETAVSHRLFTAALRSQAKRAVAAV
jgi:predicted dehydrogenase